MEEGARGGLVRCTVRESVGCVVLSGEGFPFFFFRWELFVEGGKERDVLTIECSSISFSTW